MNAAACTAGGDGDENEGGDGAEKKKRRAAKYLHELTDNDPSVLTEKFEGHQIQVAEQFASRRES